jgi:hypothetical protein
MDHLPIRPADLPYIHALRELIQTGVIAAPDLESSLLIDLPVVVRHSGVDAPAAKRAFIFIQILQQVIRQRFEGKEAETANILFGFEGYAGVPIQDRYRAVAKLYNPYWTWENYRKEPLTRHLLAVYLTLKREESVASNLHMETAHPRQGRSGLVGQDWVLEEFDGQFILPAAPNRPLETIQKRRLRAICDHVDTYRHPAYVRERGISTQPHMALLNPGTIQVADTHVDSNSNVRTYITEVKFPQPIRYGESVEFTILKQVDVQYDRVIQEQGMDWYGLVTLPSPARSARVGIQFPPGKQPRSVWRQEDIISGLVRPGTPTEDTRLAVSASGFAEYAWSDLSAGYSYGISLDW